MAYRTNEHPLKNFQFEFNQLRTDLADTISKLVNRVETHQTKSILAEKNIVVMVKHFLEQYQNLLGIYDADDYGQPELDPDHIRIFIALLIQDII
ncbi:unnamed protein product [Rotaria socialis]